MSKIFSLLFAAIVGGTAAAQSSTAATATPPAATVETHAYPKDYVLYPRVQVIEEGTGTWCGYCPLGMEALERLRKDVKSVPFVVIAVHQAQSAYSSEPMQVQDYRFLRYEGFPQVWLNRKQRLDMFNNEMSTALYKQPKKTPFKVETKVTKTDTFDYDITLTTTLGFNSPNTTLRMQYVLVEDKVGPYMQANYVSNYAQYFPNSAWLNKPNPAQTLYDDVARWIYPVGERAQREGILPTTMQRGVPVSQTFHLFLPGIVKNPENVHVVGLLIDTQTNEILNADMQKLPTVVGTSTAIVPLAPSAPSDSDTPHYDLSGRRISPSQPGLHIVKGKKTLEFRR